MAEIKPEHKTEDGENYTIANNADPKNMQELTQFVSRNYIVCYFSRRAYGFCGYLNCNLINYAFLF